MITAEQLLNDRLFSRVFDNMHVRYYEMWRAAKDEDVRHVIGLKADLLDDFKAELEAMAAEELFSI